jgi:acyl-CoA synthetase (AMP-forming)/AMP-acid ligase II
MEHRYLDTQTATLLKALETSTRLVPHRGIAIYDRRGQKADRRTYPEVQALALATAGRLASAGIQPGDTLLMCLPTSWELVGAHLGAIYLGACPVLVAPSGALGGAEAHARKIEGLIELLGSKRLLCDAATRQELNEFGASAAAALSLTTEELAAYAPRSGATASPQASDIAFMQLTSGSTGRQRAVMIRHSSVIHNALAMSDFVMVPPMSPGNCVISWLPLNHDMGLVGCLFYALINGLDLALLRPEAFLARPKLWLQLLSANPGALSPAPNFAYQLCVERIEPADLAGLDLSRWTSALTGAEMIHPQTCRAFREKFEPYGFAGPKFLPCYGMAEATLAITGDAKRTGVRTAAVPGGLPGEAGMNDVVCVGSPIMQTEVRISSPAAPGEFLGENQVGEVWVCGPSVFAGYYNEPEATAETLVTRTENGVSRCWLRTGDLGFLKDSELHITGRLKDLLIIHGHNLMPHELEWIAEHASGGGGTERAAAFSVPGGAEGEQAVLVVEVSSGDGLAELGREIRLRVGKTLGLPLADVVFAKRGQLPKTTSGKVQRRELRQRYLAGKLARL